MWGMGYVAGVHGGGGGGYVCEELNEHNQMQS